MPPQGKKKKQPKNAFYFFMVSFRRQEETKGVRFQDGWKDVAAKASPIWQVRQDWRESILCDVVHKIPSVFLAVC
jgi:hypothetical protein